MNSIQEVLDKLKMMEKQNPNPSITTEISFTNHQCPKCLDEEFVVDEANGWKARECDCVHQKRFNRRMKSAMIPSQFKDAEWSTYQPKTTAQSQMHTIIKDYLTNFAQIRNEMHNSLGFIAVIGEQKLRALKPIDRANTKRLHNNFGVGKTFIQVAAAKELIKSGYTVLIISDEKFMDELARNRSSNEDTDEFIHMIDAAIKVDVLVWDDLGKAKPSEAKMGWYYRIINERSLSKKPILFSSNEDVDTLTERIGDAATSRLIGMSKERILPVEGRDLRVQGA